MNQAAALGLAQRLQAAQLHRAVVRDLRFPPPFGERAAQLFVEVLPQHVHAVLQRRCTGDLRRFFFFLFCGKEAPGTIAGDLAFGVAGRREPKRRGSKVGEGEAAEGVLVDCNGREAELIHPCTTTRSLLFQLPKVWGLQRDASNKSSRLAGQSCCRPDRFHGS
ncbi:hypothetical protein BHE74_00034376 [Ensete ventricosum]|nr:hypothetical protein GW17_00033546 [Ensete ventricosum]RWW58730.1 hypothetical protein BHE74_00034376 [Ensete ventricosum]